MATLADAPEFTLGSLRILAVPSRGSHELSSWRVDLPPHTTSGPHSLDREQIIVVGTGTVTAAIGDEEFTAGPGDALILPPDTLVDLRNPADTASMATVISPAGFQATAGTATFAPPWSL
jgi:quercetin dioxygenase-like cupin family protein